MEGGGLECGYEDGDQLENQGHHQWVCESRVGTTGGRGPGRGEGALVQCHFPMLWSVGKKMKGVNIGLKQVDTHERLLPRNSTAKKPQASGPARKRAKKKTHPKRTQKAGTPGNRLHKGIGEFLSQPKLHELGQPIVAGDEGDDTVESVSDDAGDEDSRQSGC